MKRLDRIGLLVVILGGYALRVFRLGAQELRGDEAFGYFFSLNPYAQIVADTLALEEPHPVLSYFVQKAWISAAGASEFGLRYLGVLFSVAAITLLFRLALETRAASTHRGLEHCALGGESVRDLAQPGRADVQHEHGADAG